MLIPRLPSLVAFCVAAILAAPALAQVSPTPVGPIWSNSDAQGKCPSACARAHMEWKGVWRTTRPGMASECDCVGRSGWEHQRPNRAQHDWAWRHEGPFAGGSGNSCRAPSVRQCRGCSVTCRPGQSAHCQEGDVGIFRGPNDTICSHEARCECH